MSAVKINVDSYRANAKALELIVSLKEDLATMTEERDAAVSQADQACSAMAADVRDQKLRCAVLEGRIAAALRVVSRAAMMQYGHRSPTALLADIRTALSETR